jgi:hypothetical protein
MAPCATLPQHRSHGCHAIDELPVEILTHVRQHLGLSDLVRVAATCKRFRHGGLETVELPTESPVVTVLLKHAFSRPELIPNMRPIGCSESWVAYLSRCARQRCREALPIAAGSDHSLFVDATGRLLSCGKGAAVGHGDVHVSYPFPIPVAGMAGVRIRSVAAQDEHILALGWDGRVSSWGSNDHGQLGHGDKLARPSPAPVEGLERVCRVVVASYHSLAVTQSGDVFLWGKSFLYETELRPIMVEGFGGVRVRSVFAVTGAAYAIGEEGGIFSWGLGYGAHLGHGDRQNQPSPKRVEALRDVPMRGVSVGACHVLALAEDGLVYA